MSMTGYHKGLQEWLEQFGYPVFQQGQVPTDNNNIPLDFPFIAYKPLMGAGMTTLNQTFFAFFRRRAGENANKERDDFIDDLKVALPAEGIYLDYSDGRASVFNGGNRFIQFYDDPVNKDIIGVRVSVEIRFYE